MDPFLLAVPLVIAYFGMGFVAGWSTERLYPDTALYSAWPAVAAATWYVSLPVLAAIATGRLIRRRVP